MNENPDVDFDALLNAAWDEHAANAEGVAARLERSLDVIAEVGQVPRFVGLVTHVFGEHLGAWERGIALLGSVWELPALKSAAETSARTEAESAIARSKAALALAASPEFRCDGFSASDRARISAVAASALAARSATARAAKLFHAALAVSKELGKEDPAQRALAVTANNLAAELEEKVGRSAEERELMLHAARRAREKWELAGTWVHVERAEYRLCRSHLAAGDAARALEHARAALGICRAHADHPFELFFALEAVARAAHANGNRAGLEEARAEAALVLETLAEDQREYPRSILRELTALE